MPKLIKIIDFNDKIAIMKEIEDFEKKTVELPYETNCTVTTDGKVWNIDGTDGFHEVLKILSKKYNFKYKCNKGTKNSYKSYIYEKEISHNNAFIFYVCFCLLFIINHIFFDKKNIKQLKTFFQYIYEY